MFNISPICINHPQNNPGIEESYYLNVTDADPTTVSKDQGIGARSKS